MTDNEIIKALECHMKGQCFYCPNRKEEVQLMLKGCSKMIAENALDLIKRQKAEIERLTTSFPKTLESIKKMRNGAKAEAVKEFAERLKDESDLFFAAPTYAAEVVRAVQIDSIDNVLKEMGLEG